MKILASPRSTHYHLDTNCPLIKDPKWNQGDNKYVEILVEDVRKRKLQPCRCAIQDLGDNL